MRRATAALALLAGCSPATTRPRFDPLPQAAVILFAADPPQVAAEAVAWLGAQGVPLRRTDARDRYVESHWYTPPAADSGATASAAPAGAATSVLTRIWADPAGPGRTRVTIETVYRVVEDPSRPPRDLERLVPRGSPGGRLTDRLLAALKQRFEVL